MDDRQRQVQVGAGLQESRLNTDLIQWLERYSSWILGCLLIIVAVYFGWTRYQVWTDEKLDAAFVAHAAARGEPGLDGVLMGSPDNLLKVAAEHEGRGAVASMARLDAAHIYMGAARRGVRPGADLANIAEADALTSDQVTEFVRTAESLFSQVAKATEGRKGREMIHMRARLGISATALSLGELDRAKTALEELARVAESQGFVSQAAEARDRIVQLKELETAPRLYAAAELPEVPALTPEQLEERQKLFGIPEGIDPPTMDTPELPITPAPAPTQPQPAPSGD